MRDMFSRAVSFNQPIGTWDVSGVLDMNHMFRENKVFNQPLENWDVRNVKNMAIQLLQIALECVQRSHQSR